MKGPNHAFLICVISLVFILGCTKEHHDGSRSGGYMTLVSDSLMVIDSRSWNIIVELESNVAVDMHIPELGWLSESESGHLSESDSRKVFRIKVSENDDYDERNAVVRLSSSAGEKYVTIVQKQKDAILMSSSRVDVGQSGGIVQLKVSSSVRYDLQVSDEADGWVHVMNDYATKSLCDSTITLRIDKNESAYKRSGALLLTADDVEEAVGIYQQGETFELILNSDTFVLNSEENMVKLELKTNCSYSCQLVDGSGSVPKWIEPCDTKSLSSSTLYYSIKQNTTYDSRQAFIRICNDINDEVNTVTIMQMPVEVLCTSDSLYTLDFRKQYIYLPVSSSVEVSYVIPVDWITVENGKSKAIEDRSACLLIGQNETGEFRSADIIVQGFECRDTVVVRQQAEPVKILMSIVHESDNFASPYFLGENPFGTVQWGDGAEDEYKHCLRHGYTDCASHEASFEVWGTDGFVVDTLGRINVINIFVN